MSGGLKKSTILLSKSTNFKMAEIIPAILATDFKTVAERLRLIDGAVQWAQIDVTDGVFAPGVTWNDSVELEKIKHGLKLEVHLMVEDPEGDIGAWCKKARRIIIHHESGGRLEEMFSLIKRCGVEVGIALLSKTTLDVLDFYIGQIDVVQLMGIAEIGAQGHTFDAGVIERIKILRAKYPDVKITVDGGVSLENASRLLEAGADNLVVGAAVWRSTDPIRTIHQFQNLLPKT